MAVEKEGRLWVGNRCAVRRTKGKVEAGGREKGAKDGAPDREGCWRPRPLGPVVVVGAAAAAAAAAAAPAAKASVDGGVAADVFRFRQSARTHGCARG